MANKVSMSVTVPLKFDVPESDAKSATKKVQENLKKTTEKFNKEMRDGLIKSADAFGKKLEKEGKILSKSAFNVKMDKFGNISGVNQKFTIKDQVADQKKTSSYAQKGYQSMSSAASRLVQIGAGLDGWIKTIASSIENSLKPLQTLQNTQEKLNDINDFAFAVGTDIKSVSNIIALAEGQAGMSRNQLYDAVTRAGAQRERIANAGYGNISGLAKSDMSDAKFFIETLYEIANAGDVNAQEKMAKKLYGNKFDRKTLADLVPLFQGDLSDEVMKKMMQGGNLLASAADVAGQAQSEKFKAMYQLLLKEGTAIIQSLSSQEQRRAFAETTIAGEAYELNRLMIKDDEGNLMNSATSLRDRQKNLLDVKAAFDDLGDTLANQLTPGIRDLTALFGKTTTMLIDQASKLSDAYEATSNAIKKFGEAFKNSKIGKWAGGFMGNSGNN